MQKPKNAIATNRIIATTKRMKTFHFATL